MERVLLFGATSAIAAEAAVLHAKRGDRLLLVGRSADKLADVTRRCAGADTLQADFSKQDENDDVVARAFDRLGGVDRVLVAHGDLGDQLASERDFASASATFVANFTSVVSLLIPVANRLERAGAGRIGVITSVAGDRGRPRNYTYGAAKAALNVYLQGLRTRVYAAGVSVTTFKVGPVDTPMTRDHGKHALFAKPDAVAREIVAAMDAREGEVYVPGYWRFIMPIVKSTPERLFQRIPFFAGR